METFKVEMIKCFMVAHMWQRQKLQSHTLSSTLVEEMTASKDVFQAIIINRFVDLKACLMHETPMKRPALDGLAL